MSPEKPTPKVQSWQPGQAKPAQGPAAPRPAAPVPPAAPEKPAKAAKPAAPAPKEAPASGPETASAAAPAPATSPPPGAPPAPGTPAAQVPPAAPGPAPAPSAPSAAPGPAPSGPADPPPDAKTPPPPASGQVPGQVPGQRLVSVFSKESNVKIGAGTTAKTVKQVTYFYVAEREDRAFDVQPLSPTNVPFGEKVVVGKEKLLTEYMPEPQKYNKEVLPAMREVVKHTASGDRHRAKGEGFTAEFEYGKALKIDVENVRANFGIGLCYLARGDQDKARQVFERVCGLQDAFRSEHKHLFNEFGISMRKSGMNDEAIVYYQKAGEASPDDENLHYNIARAAFAKGDLALVKEHLKQCLTMNPQHKEATLFVKYLKKEAEARKGGK